MSRGVGLGLGLVVLVVLLAGRRKAAPAPAPEPPQPGPPPEPPAPPAPPVPEPPGPPAPPVPADLPPDASPGEWVQLVDEPGLEIRNPSRAWTTAAARAVLRKAAAAAFALGGKLTIADAGPAAGPGNAFPPHKSHRWGRDFDMAYTMDGVYPSPAGVPVDLRVPAIFESISPWVETVGVTPPRDGPFGGRPYKVSNWPGHLTHLHLRLRKDLTTEP